MSIEKIKTVFFKPHKRTIAFSSKDTTMPQRYFLQMPGGAFIIRYYESKYTESDAHFFEFPTIKYSFKSLHATFTFDKEVNEDSNFFPFLLGNTEEDCKVCLGSYRHLYIQRYFDNPEDVAKQITSYFWNSSFSDIGILYHYNRFEFVLEEWEKRTKNNTEIKSLLLNSSVFKNDFLKPKKISDIGREEYA